jgi:class 3 adenylate cyclase/tetratricopeptide (TPR) repeat protein
VVICPNCGFENADTANFCSNCGHSLSASVAPRREERKVVTVVFADLVGSTARAERIDPEDVRAILAPYHDRLRTELERFGGTVEKFIGDAVVGVFGAPVAHEDDPERAVRAALAIQDAIVELNEADAALELEVRIGVNTGDALVALGARPELGEAMVAGDVINTGARLQSAAPPGRILVGETTYRLTSRAIEYDEAEPIAAKGKTGPLPTWLALAPRARFGVDVFQTGRATLVGREREVELLAAALSRAREEQEPQLVTIVGVPGIGKSRLVYELSRVAHDDPELIVWRQGRSLPYGEGVAFWALGEIAKAQAGILESDDAEEAGEKLSAAVRDLVEETEAQWLERHLRPLIGLGGGADPGQEQRAEAFAAWRRFFEALADQGPVVLVFEDVQWADDALLDFVDELADRVAGVPLLLVCSARPELLERRPGWGGGKRNAFTVSLAPLSHADTARLIAALLDRSVLPAEEQAALLQRAGGNPLYAEEYARMLADGDAGRIEVPETLQGVVAARIDALPDDEKSLLQQASVLGKVFWTDALAALTGADARVVDERLFSLERKEFVRREQRSAVAGARQYVFVHALVRDGAYGQMPRIVRAESHRRAAEWIDLLPSDRAEDRSEMLAHHLVEAVEYGRAAGIDVTELLPKAARALRDAGDRAWALGAPHSALGLFEQAITLDPATAEDPYLLLRLGRARLIAHGGGERELERAAAALAGTDSASAADAEVARGEVIWQRGDQEGAFRHFDRAASLLEQLPTSLQKGWILSQLARFLGLAGRSREGDELAERAIAVAEELGDKELLGDALNTRGLVRSQRGESGWRDDFERSLALALENDSWRAQRAYLNLGSTLITNDGDLRRGVTLYREGLRMVERRGSGLSERWFRGNLAEATFYLGLWDEALDLAKSQLDNPEPHYLQHVCREVRAYIRLARGDVTGAATDSDASVVDARAIRDPQALIPSLSMRAFLLTRMGRTAEVETVLAELADARRALESQPGGAWIVDLAFALLELGREAEFVTEDEDLELDTPWREAAVLVVGRDLLGAADSLEAIGAVTSEAYARLRAAAWLSSAGERDDAEEQLARALAFYRGVGATAYVREGEVLLAAAS